MIIGYWWANFAGKKSHIAIVEEEEIIPVDITQPSVTKAFLPVIVPIVLIAVQSFFVIDKAAPNIFINVITSLGDPVIALSIGVLLAFNCKKSWNKKIVSGLLQEAAEKAGGILI